jgi:hypothetical protein
MPASCLSPNIDGFGDNGRILNLMATKNPPDVLNIKGEKFIFSGVFSHSRAISHHSTKKFLLINTIYPAKQLIAGRIWDITFFQLLFKCFIFSFSSGLSWRIRGHGYSLSNIIIAQGRKHAA